MSLGHYYQTLLQSYGFTIGERDPSVNPDFPGNFMVTDGEDWAIVGDNLNALMHETIKFHELDPYRIYDWQDPEDCCLDYALERRSDRINIAFRDGKDIWVELEDGTVRIHAYSNTEDEPVSLTISDENIEVNDA